MMMSQVAEALDAKLYGQDVLMTGVSKDTRDIDTGDLYIALVGERFDGHQFVEDAGSAGAVGALVSERLSLEMPQVEVDDTRIALGRLAAYWRQDWASRQVSDAKLIGITGSNGKTSVKEMCREILAGFVGEQMVLSTRGNLNNDIGMPMMLLELREKHRYAVIEMGANHVGEIDYLTSIARPDVAILNNVGPAHLEGFGSLENIAKAKSEIYNGLTEDGFAIINRDDVFSPQWFEYCEQQCPVKNIVSFSMKDKSSQVYAEKISENTYSVVAFDQQAELALSVPGKHNVMNALAAIAATSCVGVPLTSAVSSLSDFENIKGRLTVIDAPVGYRVIDDSYNANPLSVSAAIDVLAEMQVASGDAILVLGDMAELGEDAQRLHDDIAKKAKTAGIKAFYATGKYFESAVNAFGENGYWFEDKTALADALIDNLTGSEIVLIKGSRSAAMEKVVERILTHEKNKKRVN